FGTIFDDLISQKNYDYNAKVKVASEAKKHDVYNGIYNVYIMFFCFTRYFYFCVVIVASEAKKHDVYNGIYNVGPGVSSMGKGDIYAGQAAHI
ncbi:hypothetical protein DRJ70_13745, partial [Enterococcus faecalis]